MLFGSGQGVGGVGDLLLPRGELRFQPLFHRRQPYRFAPVHAGLDKRDFALEPGNSTLGLQPAQFPGSELGLINGEQVRLGEVNEIVRVDQQPSHLATQGLALPADGFRLR